MKDVVLLITAAVLSAAAAAGTTLLVAQTEARDASDPSGAVTAGGEALTERLATLEERQVELERFLESIPAETPPSTQDGLSEAAVARAVDAWLEENADALVAVGAADAGAATSSGTTDPALAALREAPVGQLIELLTDPDLSGEERQAAWERLAQAGRLEAVVAELERMAELDPQDPDLRVTLGSAYLQQLFQGGSGPQAGVLATKADEAFDAALQLDKGHWDARFLKAVSLSNWPAFLGKQGEAIAEFERLIEIQEQRTPESQHAQSYLFLGNMYLEQGKVDEALAAWNRGLERFPASDQLREQLQRNGGGR